MNCKVLIALALTAFALAECRSAMSMESEDGPKRTSNDLHMHRSMDSGARRRMEDDGDRMQKYHFEEYESRKPGQSFPEYVMKTKHDNSEYERGMERLRKYRGNSRRNGNAWSDEDNQSNEMKSYEEKWQNEDSDSKMMNRDSKMRYSDL